MIGYGRHVGAYRSGRIEERSAILNLQPIQRIRIVTAPDLRRIIHHPGIKPSAAAAAALNQHIRITFHEILQKFIDAQHIVMGHLPRTPLLGINIGNAPVHIPFYILHIALIQYTTNLFKYMIPYFCPGKIKYKLISGMYRLPARYPHDPVRMGAVQIAVFGNHLRFNPDPELHTQTVNALN